MQRIYHVLSVARNSFRETIRDRVLYAILAFALLYFGLSLYLSVISLGEDMHVIKSLGLAGTYLFSLIITVFLGTSLIYKEIEKRTLYFILTKPITRAEVIVGKFLGLLASVSLCVIGMLGVYLAMVAFKGGGFDSWAILATWYQLLDLSVLIALSILFSTFAQPLAATLYAVVVIYIGHSLSVIMTYAKTGAAVKALLTGVYYVLPNLEKFNIRDLVIYGMHPSLSGVFAVTGYAVLYVAFLLFLSVKSFNKREL